MLQRVKEVQESDLRMSGNLAHNIQRVIAVTQAQIDAAAAQGKAWVVKPVVKVSDPIDNLRGGTQLVIKQNAILPGQNVMRVMYVGGTAVVVGPGTSPLSLPDATANDILSLIAFGGTEQNGTPTPDVPVDIVCNNGVLKARHQSGLPLGYTLLDSVVFDATQVIDTGFVPDNDTRIESKCYRTGEDCWFYGASPSNPRITLYHSRAGTCRWGNQSLSSVGFVADTEYTIIEDKNGLNINGVNTPWASGTAGDFTCDRSLTIGNNNGSTGTRYFAGNFYYMKIYNNGVLARDFVPCQNASNVVGLYDRANGVFYTDTGLVAGNTVSDPVEIYTDGPIETIAIKDDQDATVSTATCEDLLSVGAYTDEQEIISGVVTRKVGIKVLDGTEDGWLSAAAVPGYYYLRNANMVDIDITADSGICSHFKFSPVRTAAGMTVGEYTTGIELNIKRLMFKTSATIFPTLEDFQSWLTAQYAAGTPVIVIYPLATPTTNTVTPQPMQTAEGDNTAEITQASLDNLELQVEYIEA